MARVHSRAVRRIRDDQAARPETFTGIPHGHDARALPADGDSKQGRAVLVDPHRSARAAAGVELEVVAAIAFGGDEAVWRCLELGALDDGEPSQVVGFVKGGRVDP